jgi:hypothetical protein
VGKVEAYGRSPDEEHTKQAWSAVAETFKFQQRDFVAAWNGADRFKEERMEVDMYPAMYDCAKTAMDALSLVTSQLVAPHVAVAGSTGGSLANTLQNLLPRSQARIEVQSYDAISQENDRLKRELAEAKALVERKSKDVSHMHTYEARRFDCLQSISKAMRQIAQTLREFV